jgi:diguanylate cyclase (GGDEF)-like protein
MIYQVMPLVITIGTFWISNSLMERKLEDISRIDSLTGVYNRSAFMLLSEGIFDNEKTRNRFYDLAMCDLDKFKQVNDSYGHIAGDGVLKHVARIISENIRGEDILGRYGGEEFVVLISVSSKETLEKILERIRYNIEKSPYKYNDQEIRVTISIGAVLIKESEKDLQKYIEEADNLLYDAKHSGRNRVKI